MSDIKTPPSEIEIAETIHGLPGPLGGVVCRLVFHRDKLASEVERLHAENARLQTRLNAVLEQLEKHTKQFVRGPLK